MQILPLTVEIETLSKPSPKSTLDISSRFPECIVICMHIRLLPLQDNRIEIHSTCSILVPQIHVSAMMAGYQIAPTLKIPSLDVIKPRMKRL